MHRAPRNVVCLALLTVALGLAACSDETGGGPVSYTANVTVRVVDESGDPVPGLLMNLVSNNPYLQDYRRDKAATSIEFTVAHPTRVRLVIEDIEGAHVKTLIDDELVAGRHRVAWNGTDDGNVRQHSGRYTVRMTAFVQEGEGTLFTDTIDGLMCLLDPQRSTVGVTDKKGRITLDDPRLFPHIYDREPMVAYDENGEIRGWLDPTAQMIFTLADTVNGGLQTFREEVESRSSFEFVWRTAPVTVKAGATAAADYGPDGSPSPEEEMFRLGPIFPNPFN